MSAAPVFARVRSLRGWQWLLRAYALFARARMYWLLLILSYWLITVAMSLVPYIGVAVATLLKPVFAVGFLAAAWSLERAESPRLGRLFDGFRSNIAALLPLGAVYAAGIAAALVLSAAMDGGALMRLALFGEAQPEGNIMATPGIQSAMLLAAVAAVPTLLALWFAPALIVFQDQPTFRAMATSLRAALANPGAIIVYWAAVFMFWMIIPGAIVGMGAMFGKYGAVLGVALATPLMLAIVAIIHVGDYVIYRDLFHHGETTVPKQR